MSKSAQAAGLLAGLVIAASVAAATPTAAASLLIDSIEFVDTSPLRYGTATPVAGSPEFTFILSPFVITSPALADATLAFCLDFDLDLPIGDVSLPYEDFDFATGTPADVERIGQLVNYGKAVFSQGDAPGGLGEAAIYELSVIQAAIWTITDPEYVFAFAAAYHPSDPDLVAELNSRIGIYAAGGKPGYAPLMRTITNPEYQPLAMGVPEPATWTLMIGGLAGAGAALRRGRRPAGGLSGPPKSAPTSSTSYGRSAEAHQRRHISR